MNQLLSRYQRDLALKGYSPRTCQHYYSNLKQFLAYYHEPANQLDNEKIKDYLYYLLSEKKASDSKIRQAHGALKYFCTQTLSMPWLIESVPQLKNKKKLPNFFTYEEVSSLLNHCSNLKHKALLMLTYSSGLRVSEVVKIKLSNIKRRKKRLLVEQGKGARDRYTVLSEVCLKCLDQYWIQYHPKYWLFPGRGGKSVLSTRACQHAFYSAKDCAGITKKGGVHMLRHSFATHFLEMGGGIFQLQKFLGHRNLKTTLIYAHVQEENIIAESPLDYYGK